MTSSDVCLTLQKRTACLDELQWKCLVLSSNGLDFSWSDQSQKQSGISKTDPLPNNPPNFLPFFLPFKSTTISFDSDRSSGSANGDLAGHFEGWLERASLDRVWGCVAKNGAATGITWTVSASSWSDQAQGQMVMVDKTHMLKDVSNSHELWINL